MSLTSLVVLFVLCLALFFMVVGMTLYWKRNKTINKPTLLGMTALFLQILLILLLLSGIFMNINGYISYLLYWGIVFYSLIIGVIGLKNNIFVPLLTIFLSILLIIFMAFKSFIISM